MADTAHSFIRGNLMSPVVKGNVYADGRGYYRLKDGNIYRLSASQMEALGRVMGRTGFSIRYEMPKPE